LIGTPMRPVHPINGGIWLRIAAHAHNELDYERLAETVAGR